MSLSSSADANSATAEITGADKPKAYKMQDLMQAIADQSDLKRSELREAAGLVCEAIGRALDDGQVISLPGLGKITPRKRDSKPSGDLLTARIKLMNKGEKLTPTEPEDDPEKP
ncbi:HU family DNA-binding protein [Nioella sp. MMSF_3534]|uniref:HU family DNA-binding protein n=1 Tax=Nioella sp. MMSF_3534 TaxID=3046720 RepID=UPI00273F2037|nr:HU family DNA-binding protein [Nioella sp. MMSF_3534]